jgi:hypothetical protein
MLGVFLGVFFRGDRNYFSYVIQWSGLPYGPWGRASAYSSHCGRSMLVAPYWLLQIPLFAILKKIEQSNPPQKQQKIVIQLHNLRLDSYIYIILYLT